MCIRYTQGSDRVKEGDAFDVHPLPWSFRRRFGFLISLKLWNL